MIRLCFLAMSASFTFMACTSGTSEPEPMGSGESQISVERCPAEVALVLGEVSMDESEPHEIGGGNLSAAQKRRVAAIKETARNLGGTELRATFERDTGFRCLYRGASGGEESALVLNGGGDLYFRYESADLEIIVPVQSYGSSGLAVAPDEVAELRANAGPMTANGAPDFAVIGSALITTKK